MRRYLACLLLRFFIMLLTYQQTTAKLGNLQNEHEGSNENSLTTYKNRKLMTKSFQWKLFWKDGIEWQNNFDERSWCAVCNKICKAGETVRIRECDKNEEKQKWTFTNGDKMISAKSKLCIDYETKELLLKPCSNNRDKYQKFKGFDAKKKFQLHPFNNEKKCVSQKHHPKDNEKLKIASCRRAEENNKNQYDDTSHWVFGVYHGH